MRTLVLLCLAGCASIPPTSGSNHCGMLAMGNYDGWHKSSLLTWATLQDATDRALDATTMVTDPRLFDIIENCKALGGYRVFTRDAPDWEDDYGRGFRTAGYTFCPSKVIVIGTPASGDFRESSLIHEMFHAMQNCVAEQPPDVGADTIHAGWVRYNIFQAIDAVR